MRSGRRCRRSGRRRRRGRRTGDRQEAERVEVALLVGRDPDTEVDVRHVELGRAARPDGADGRSFADGRVARDGERAEMREA